MVLAMSLRFLLNKGFMDTRVVPWAEKQTKKKKLEISWRIDVWSKYSFCFSDPIHSLCKKRRKSCLGCAIYSYIQVKLSFNARVRVRYVQSRLRLWLYFALNVRCERFSALYHVRYGQVWHYLGTFFIKAVDFSFWNPQDHVVHRSL